MALAIAEDNRAMGGVREITGEWCVVRTRGQAEAAVARRLADRAFGCYYPVERVRQIRRGRGAETIERPLYPTYLFAAYADEYARHEIRRTRDVIELLVVHGFRQTRLAQQVADLERTLAEHPFADVVELTAGRRVRVTSGPMEGVEGRVIRRDRRVNGDAVSRDVLYVGVDMLGQRGVETEIDPLAVEPL